MNYDSRRWQRGKGRGVENKPQLTSQNMWPAFLKLNKEIKRSNLLHAILTAPQVTTVPPSPPSPSSLLSLLSTSTSVLPWGDEDDEKTLLTRRANSLGPVYRLFYDKPLHFVRGRGSIPTLSKTFGAHTEFFFLFSFL
jgi:hypothetical protein